ncbi:sugar phosphate isomerase/epimerase family protein [Streptomyces hoynatensis]|uniref:Sugar phosphate isomerase/epimerase n=1 Tax=Streptomyces hoynatensis TaxID=1141874 RepID=A0A3A9YK15_9ACTN|nr:sugar phosphate isomerase/epimerase [Streptomyces hoynatensis]RKN37068.1 sugar phosphate isomerase/epimerase [Streptomyces hoynatensis]
MAPPLGVQLYTVREALAADRNGVLARIAELGYKAVEPFQPTDDPEGFRRVADDLGLTIPGAHAIALLDEEPGPVFEAIATLGAELAIVPAGIPHEDFTTAEGIGRAAERLNALSELAAGHGLRLAYHNHWWEVEPLVQGRHALDVLAGELAEQVALEVDTYWAAVGGADVPGLLGRLGDRVRSLHVKDGPLAKEQPHVAVGSGAMAVPEILAAAPGAWRVVELDSCATDVFGALAESRAYLDGLGEAA